MYLHKMRRKITKKIPYTQEQNAYQAFFSAKMADYYMYTRVF